MFVYNLTSSLARQIFPVVNVSRPNTMYYNAHAPRWMDSGICSQVSIYCETAELIDGHVIVDLLESGDCCRMLLLLTVEDLQKV